MSAASTTLDSDLSVANAAASEAKEAADAAKEAADEAKETADEAKSSAEEAKHCQLHQKQSSIFTTGIDPMSDDAHRIKYLSLAVVAMEAHDPTAPLTRVVRAVLGLNEARSDGERQLWIVALRSALDEMGSLKTSTASRSRFRRCHTHPA